MATDRTKNVLNEPNMRRHPDMLVTEVIGYADDDGRIAELEIRGEHAGYEEAPTWMLAFVDKDATFRMHALSDNTECELTGLDVYVPESLLANGLPDGINSITISRGTWTHVGTVRGTRRAIRDFVRDNWTDASDDPDEQLRAWMDLVTEVSAS